ncbi:MFS general substrate transporter [Viridothelium virens]|uniref:MFS general substrate transporter n=1 Tax=Viridothelium virens TaxID=1048519 RepID=A0A6A6HPF9_VIRVR|nr:MFS general substrate transporter [Viridothelium virens]
MFSPMSSFIFYPAISPIANGIGVSVELINLTITSYMVVSGVTPALLGNVADKGGRRPVYIVALSTYIIANIGLALQNSFPGLLILRMIQSAGSSGTISLGYGVMSDIATPAERGSYVGILLMGPNVAPPLGPVLGGAITSRLGWKWIFWVLCILSGVCLMLLLFLLHETARSIVGNGSTPPTRIVHKTFLQLMADTTEKRVERTDEGASNLSLRLNLPNPLLCLRLLFVKDVAIVLICNGICYAAYCCIQASLSSLIIKIYNFNELQAGLIYLPFGFACLSSSFLSGRLLDYDYAKTAKAHGFVADRRHGEELGQFPLEKARLRSVFVLLTITSGSLLCYGWVMQLKVHISVPLILQVFIGFAISGVFTVLGTLLTDFNPQRSSTAAASANIVRCALAASSLAVLQLIIDAIGAGWCFTIIGTITAICIPLTEIERRKGPNWRRDRASYTARI